MFQKIVIVDAKDHLMGRLASVVAKELLNGQKVVVVRCEALQISGSLYRNKLKFDDFLLKRFSTNPSRGHFHERSPSKIFRRCVRGMMPYKTTRGAQCLDKLEAYEGIPEKYETKKKWIVKEALRVVKIQAHRKFCVLSDLSQRVGWKYSTVVNKMEVKRKQRQATWYNLKAKQVSLLKQAKKEVASKTKSVDAKLAKLGY